MQLLIHTLTSTAIQLNHNSLHWRHNDHNGISNHQPHGCLLNHLFRRRSKKTSKFRVTGLCVGNSPGPVNSPHKGPVTQKMFPFDDVIMQSWVRDEWLHPTQTFGCDYSFMSQSHSIFVSLMNSWKPSGLNTTNVCLRSAWEMLQLLKEDNT